MELFGDYHTHTIYSHGKGTIKENVEAAIKKGLKEIAITDHGPSHATYGIKRRNLAKMRYEIDRLNEQYKEINILLGVESNLIGLDGTIDVNEEDIRLIDKLLMGFHNGAVPKSIKDGNALYIKNYFSKLFNINKNACRKLNTEAYISALKRYKIDFVTHPGAKIDLDIRQLAKVAAQTGTALEINSSHGNLTVEYAKIALEENALFVINSDAHVPSNVGNFTKGIEIAQNAGIPKERIINAKI